MTQLYDRNRKQLFTLKITTEELFELISEKKTINVIEYNVYFNCEKVEEKFAKKFEIPKNMRIIRK